MSDVIKHLDLSSADGAQLNMDALYQIMPSAFTEVRDEKTGEVTRKVNFEVLHQLDLFANNIKTDRTDLDLLYGSMLAWGVRLDLPLQTEQVDGCTVYTVNDGDLVACFSEGITDKVVAAMAEKSPLRVLFRDACFKEDAQKINIYEQFKQALDWADDDAFKNIRVI